MTINQRQFRSPDSRIKQLIDRIYREADARNAGTTSFAGICDMISIPRDLRAGLLDELVREGYLTAEDDRVRLTEAGKAIATTQTTAPLDDTPRNPSPNDSESRARMRGSRRG
jgi:predicted methyltransferase